MGVVVHKYTCLCVVSCKILKWWNGSPIHEYLVLSEKLPDDLNSSILLLLSRRGLLCHGVSISKGDLGNAMDGVSCVLHIGISCSLQCVQGPDQLPC